jgi:hypothetical protein
MIRARPDAGGCRRTVVAHHSSIILMAALKRAAANSDVHRFTVTAESGLRPAKEKKNRC